MIGEGIKITRKRFGFTQTELADKIGITRAHLSFVESGKTRPSSKLMERISDGLDVPVPIIHWFGLKREEISDDKKHIYDILKPAITEALETII